MIPRLAKGTTYLNVPAKCENISFHTDVESALKSRSRPLPKLGPYDPSKLWRKQLKNYSQANPGTLTIRTETKIDHGEHIFAPMIVFKSIDSQADYVITISYHKARIGIFFLD